ncbi:DUF3108 domain-containing protein [Candidatus Halocynthiibacter alkanivorans]|uniref:DUF3108 domain-containing protein n=1 Tax=Candidatus Halocynthiibacter alkanivorans TaxID=2267619 RepID=UPI000DF300FF|nr:DUF3108 domain-containing protein [Candidatus Halocynthiibacter alkanivorans]
MLFSQHAPFATCHTKAQAKTTSLALTCFTLLLAISQPAWAAKAYQATYTASFKAQVNINGTLKRSLTEQQNGQWLFKDDISALLASIKESSELRIKNNKVIPLKYQYLRKVIGKKKKQTISFDWAKNQAVNKNSQVITLKDNTQDPLSYQLQLQLDLQNGHRGNFEYPYTKKNKIERLKFIEVGSEVIDTPLGKLKSIKLKLDRGPNAKRETFIWFSIKHNFIISQLKQTEADGKSYSIVLKELKL